MKAAAEHRTVGVCQVYNELRAGNLARFVKYFAPLVDALVAYDDGSTDGSGDFLQEHTPYVIRGRQNDFAAEVFHKQLLLERALELHPDFILWLDADEVLSGAAAAKLPELYRRCADEELDGFAFHELNLWRSASWRRTDSLFDDGWFVRLWRVTPGIEYTGIERGLHKQSYPTTLKKIICVDDLQVIHYGFASERSLARKYLTYQAHGQSGYVMLDRLIDESQLVLEKVPAEIFPPGLYFDDERPRALSLDEARAYVARYGESVRKIASPH